MLISPIFTFFFTFVCTSTLHLNIRILYSYCYVILLYYSKLIFNVSRHTCILFCTIVYKIVVLTIILYLVIIIA